MKKTTIALTLLTASLALAASVCLGAKGSGAAKDSTGREITFCVNMKKVRTGDRVNTFGSGYFRWAKIEAGHKKVAEFALSPTQEFNKMLGVATFAGDGKLNSYTDGVLTFTRLGRLTGKLTDRRAATATEGEPDLVQYRFAPSDGGPALEFSGAVIRGDVSVYEEQIP
jgi:hypothetical protein